MTPVAHVSYVGGGIFLPDHGPENRRTIIEYVARLTRSKQKVQILLDNERWLVQSGAHVCCAGCQLATDTSCREAAKEAEIYCLRCALSLPARLDTGSRVAPRHLTLTFSQA